MCNYLAELLGITEPNRLYELDLAVKNVESGAQFAFYDMDILKEELFSHVPIIQNANFVLYSTFINPSKFLVAILDLGLRLIPLFKRLVKRSNLMY